MVIRPPLKRRRLSYSGAMTGNRTTTGSLTNRLKKVGGLNVIFQVTDRCVLSCRYCFAKGSHRVLKQKEFMSPELLDAAIKQSFNTRHASITFEWTGGEPFLAGLDFYRQVVRSQKKHADREFTNTVQTSGYLFDPELIDFFVKNGFHISMTIDGPKGVHNFNRPAPGFAPSLNRILKTRNYIVEKQGSCGAIVTITRKSIGNEGKILDFYRALGMNCFHSNPYVYFDGNLVKDRDIGLSNEDYASYFINQFNAWFETGKKTPAPVTVDYILKCIAARTGLSNTLCTFGGRCLTNFIAIVPNGDAYPCPKFTGSQTMLLGNIGETAMSGLLSHKSPRMKKILADRTSAINKCEKADCRYRFICNSGCPYYSFIAGNGKHIGNRDRLCKGKRMVFRYLEGVMMNLGPQTLE